MKAKFAILSVVFLIFISFFLSSFKNDNKVESRIALLDLMNVKGENEGFIITYGDGTIEKKNFDTNLLSVEKVIQLQLKTALIMNEMSEKGYHYIGSHSSNLAYMVFEKK